MTDTRGKASARSVRSSSRHRQLSEKVANEIRESIMAGELRPGFLRTEHLADDLGVSPTPVREALMILQAEGAVQWKPRRGFRLVPMTAQELEDLYEVQAYIAGELAARAAVSLSDEQIERLERIQDEIQDEVRAGNVEQVGRLNHEFHRTINTASGSARLTNLLRQTAQYVPRDFFERIDGRADTSAHDHSAVLIALRKRSKPAARKAMAAHVRHIGSLLLAYLNTQGILQ